MQVAPSPAIIEVVPLAAIVPIVRGSEATTRQRAKNGIAPPPIGRGQLIDLVV